MGEQYWPLSWQFLGVGLLGFFLAASLGANDVANSMGTSVGTGALSMRQALILAGILEFAGAVFFGDRVTQTLTTQVAVPAVFATQPQILLLGMIAVLLAGAAWLQIATSLGLPVSSSHAVVGAIAGFTGVSAGLEAINWQSLGTISLVWLITPVVSGAIAFLLSLIIRYGILHTPNPQFQLQEWLPWLSLSLAIVFGSIVAPVVSERFWATQLTNQVIDQLGNQEKITRYTHNKEIIAAICLLAVGIFLYSCWSGQGFKDRATLEATGELEQQFGRLQRVSAGFVAFAHGANDVGNAIAPLAIIWQILQTGQAPVNLLPTPLPVLILGGAGIVTGLGLWGKKVMGTIGQGITPLRPSGGLIAEFATATTVLVASRWGLPVSTSHALVGAVVGIGLIQGRQELDGKIIKNIALAWLVTIPTTASLTVLIFEVFKYFLPLI